jgi:hypothetical protein
LFTELNRFENVIIIGSDTEGNLKILPSAGMQGHVVRISADVSKEHISSNFKVANEPSEKQYAPGGMQNYLRANLC